ncbi:hypothetical protein [Deinococcus sp. PESE-13]
MLITQIQDLDGGRFAGDHDPDERGYQVAWVLDGRDLIVDSCEGMPFGANELRPSRDGRTVRVWAAHTEHEPSCVRWVAADEGFAHYLAEDVWVEISGED